MISLFDHHMSIYGASLETCHNNDDTENIVTHFRRVKSSMNILKEAK